MSLSSTKPRVHYTEIDSCRLGDHAYCFVIDHPRLAPEWIYTSRVEHIARDGREPIFETRNSIYLPAGGMFIVAVGALLGDSDREEKGVFDLIQGLTPVNPKALEEYLKTMNQEVIPEIVKVVEERRILAAESRHWQLKC